jgi:hypothetical protein
MARLQQETQAAVTTGSADQPAFPARWLTAYTWSPWRAGLSGHHVATTRVPRVALDTSIGVSGHHDFTVRIVLFVGMTKVTLQGDAPTASRPPRS